MPTEATVFVVDDDSGMRESLSYLLESVGLKVETFASGQEFLSAYDPTRPGCLLLDLRMPGMSGLRLQEELVRRQCILPIIVITAFAEVPTAVRVMKLGAVDFIEKPFGDDELLERVSRAIVLDRRTRLRAAEREDATARLASLSPREREVMDRVVAGKPNKVTAVELGISEKTVEHHRHQVVRKLKVGSLAELIRLVSLTEEVGENPE